MNLLNKNIDIISEDDSEFERKAEITLKIMEKPERLLVMVMDQLMLLKMHLMKNGFVYTHFLDYSEHSLSSGSSSKAAAYVYLKS